MTNAEKEWLVRILADPDDETVRLIFADWLEERGDPRGHLVRLAYGPNLVAMMFVSCDDFAPDGGSFRYIFQKAMNEFDAATKPRGGYSWLPLIPGPLSREDAGRINGVLLDVASFNSPDQFIEGMITPNELRAHPSAPTLNPTPPSDHNSD